MGVRTSASRVVGVLRAIDQPSDLADRARDALDRRWRASTYRASPWFDPEWYLTQHPDVRAAGADPLAHFLDDGEREGRDPGPDFDTNAYIRLNPAADGRALAHFHRTVEAAPNGAELRPQDIVDLRLEPLRTGWADPRWYLDHHPQLTPADLRGRHPWFHMSHGLLDPSPYFDVDDYRAQLDGNLLAGVEPLDHWLASADDGGPRPRVVARVDPARPHLPLVQHRIAPRSVLRRVRVAAMIHAFYVDVLPELLEPLAHLPSPPTVLVSVVDTADADAAHRCIDEVLGGAHPRVVKIVPNRGRNFAPLLCSFGEELRAHELVVHLHTKKSLYSGSEQSPWRRHLVDSLLPSPAGVDAIMSLLAPDRPGAPDDASPTPRVGLVQAPSLPDHLDLPFWASHWLGNRPHGARLYERLGLDPRRAEGSLVYPVGGMFWARTDALVPLLDLGLRVGDFEREVGQADRTLAHAIERTIPASAGVAGYATVEFDADAAQWRLNWSDADAHESDDAARDRLLGLLGDADLVSVDLFDTLLLRPLLDPAATFDVLAGDLAREDPAVDATATVRARRAAESTLRTLSGGPGDVTLDEIYERAIDDLPVHRDALRSLRRLELDLEIRLATPRRWLIDLIAEDRRTQPGQRRFVLMTDTTQPRHAIERLLAEIDAQDLFDDLYVSSACRARKDSGTMWDLVELVEGVPRHRWLHIGDNEFSDLQHAADRGISWFATPRPGAHGPPRVRIEKPADDLGATLVAGQALASGASGVRRSAGVHESAGDVGYHLLGPLVLTFVTWAVDTARARGIDHLLFASRDGYLAHRVFRTIRPFLPDTPPPSDDLYVSRRVALGAIQGDEIGLRQLIDAAHFTGPVHHLLAARAGIDLAGRGVDELLDTVVRLPDDADWLHGELCEHLDAFTERASDERRALAAALADLGLTPERRLGLVDLGYSATAQQALTTAFPLDMVGLYACTTRRADRLGDRVEACFGRGSREGDGNLVYDHSMVFEALCAAPLAQATRFHRSTAGLRLESDPDTRAPDHVAAFADVAQSAALAFVCDLIDRFGPEAVTTAVRPDTVHEALADAHGRLLPRLDDAVAGLTIDDRFCGRGDAAVSP